MQITTRAIVLAVALFASAPLLAANSGTSTAGTDASKQETQTTAEQDDCTLPTLSSTDLSAGLAGLCQSPAARRRTRPKSIAISARLRLACVHWACAGMTSQGCLAKRAFPLLRCLLVQARPGLGKAHCWKAHVMQTVFPPSDPFLTLRYRDCANHQDGRATAKWIRSFRWNDEPERQLCHKKAPPKRGYFLAAMTRSIRTCTAPKRRTGRHGRRTDRPGANRGR